MNAILRKLLRIPPPETPLPDRLTVRVGGREMQFDTRSAIAKLWFYPRYASGVPHERPIVDWLIERIAPDTQFLDVGANVGFYTTLVAAFCPQGHVVAVDVDPRLIGEILSNIGVNGFSHAEAICGAAWESDGDILAFEPEQIDNLSTNRIVTNPSDATVGCVSFTIDSLCRQRGFKPTAAKIDVEGAESQVIRGMKETLKGIKVLLLEVHPSRITAMGEAVSDLHKSLDAAGFSCSLVEDHRGEARMRPLRSVDDWTAITANGMVLCEKPAAD